MEENKTILVPWEIDIEERVRYFESAKKNGEKVALYYAKAPDSSTYRYRVYNVSEALNKSKKWKATFFYQHETEFFKELIPKADLFIFSRQSRWDKKIEELISIVKGSNIPFLFDLDDLVFNKKYIMTVVNTIGETNNFDFWIPYFDRIQKTAENVEGFLATNDFLGEKISRDFNRPYKVIRNFLNEAQISASNAYLSFKTTPKKQGKFIIGYFSGSPTHVNDLRVALPELVEFLSCHPNSILRVVGLMEFDEKTRHFLRNGQIEFISPVDFRKLQRLMAEVDVNIAPLVLNDFTNCKSELKFFEAAVVETTTIASPNYSFKKAITDGKNGFLAQPGEWYDKLEYLYKNPEENRKIAKRAKEYALKHYYGPEVLKEIEEAYDYFAK